MSFPLNPTSKEAITRHFKLKSQPWTEDFFIQKLSSPKKYDVYWATIALRECGSKAAVPPLKGLIHHSMKDVKCTSLLTVAHLAGAGETEFYGKCLLDPV